MQSYPDFRRAMQEFLDRYSRAAGRLSDNLSEDLHRRGEGEYFTYSINLTATLRPKRHASNRDARRIIRRSMKRAAREIVQMAAKFHPFIRLRSKDILFGETKDRFSKAEAWAVIVNLGFKMYRL